MTAAGTTGRSAQGGSTVAERWGRLERRWQVVLVLGAALVVAAVLSQFAGGILNSPSPPVVGPASSYDTSGTGTAAFSQLLRDRLYPIRQLAVPIRLASLPAGATVFVLDPDSGLAGDLPAMHRILAGGGRLVLGGRSATSQNVVQSLVAAGGAEAADGQPAGLSAAGALPAWRPGAAGVAHPATRSPETLGVSSLDTGTSGSFALPSAPSRFRVLLEGDGGPFAMIAKLGAGTVVLLASSEPLQNSGLGHLDDAAFGLDLAGSPATPVVFDEYDHGAGRASAGLAGLPGHWKGALALALVALLVWLLAASRRFGPPEPAQRELVPPRVAHVDAMATLLAAGPARRLAEGAGPLRSEARRRLCRRLRADVAAPESELRLRAAGEGFPARMVDALLQPPATADDLVSLGRAVVAIDEIGRGGRPPRLPEGQEE